MGENRTIRLTDGQRDFAVNPAELDKTLRALPAKQRRNLRHISGDITSVYPNEKGVLVRKPASLEQVINLIERGEDPIVTSADAPNNQKYLSQQQRRERASADSDPWMRTVNAFTPFIGQALQNEALGTKTAVEARARLNSADKGTGFVADVAAMVLGGAALKGLTAGTKLGAALGKTKGVQGFLNFQAADAAATTYFEAKRLVDYDKPFVAEDFAQELLLGQLITLPFSSATAVRGAALSGARGLASKVKGGAGGATKALDAGADMLVAGGILAPGAVSRDVFKGAVVGRIIGRSIKRLRGKKPRMAPQIDQVGQARKFHAMQQQQIGNFTPEKLRGMTPTKRSQALIDVSGYAGRNADDLLDINFETIHDRTNDIRKGINVAQKHALNINKKVGNPNLSAGPMDIGQEARYVARSNELWGKIEAAGFGDIANYIEPLVYSKNPRATLGQWMQARLDARYKRGDTGGGAQVDDWIGEFLEDSGVWSSDAQRGSRVNQAINDVTEARSELLKMNIPKNLEQIQAGSAARLTSINRELDRLRKGYATLEREGLLTRSQVRGIETSLTDVEGAITRGAGAYSDAGRINAVRTEAAKATDFRLGEIVQASEDIKALQAASIEHELKNESKLMQLLRSGKIGDTIEKTAGVLGAASVGGVIALRELDKRDREVLFDHLQQTLAHYTGSPEAMEHGMEQVLAHTASEPEGNALAGMAMGTTLFHLAQNMPKSRNSLYPHRATGRAQQWAFLNRFAAAQSPTSVAVAAVQGRVTPEMIETLKMTRPAMYNRLVNMFSEVIAEKGVEHFPRKTMAGIQKFIGGLDPIYRGGTLLRLQSDAAQNPQQQSIINPGGNPQQQGTIANPGQLRPNRDPQSGASNYTTSQRLQAP